MDKATRMYSLLDRQATSDKSIKDFCADEGISYATFHYWRRRRRDRASTAAEALPPTAGFISLRCSPGQPTAADRLTVALPGGLELRLDCHDVDRLADLLHRLDRHYAEL